MSILKSRLSNYRLQYFFLMLALLAVYTYLIMQELPNPDEPHQTICVFKNVTGFACPGCGTTRATMSLLHGHIKDAIWFNALSIPLNALAVICFFWMLYDLIRGKATCFKRLLGYWPRWLTILVISAVLLNYIWNLWKGI